MHDWEFYRSCVQLRLKSQEGWSQGWWEAEIQEKSFEKVCQREGNILRRKQWKQRAKPMSLGPFDHDSCEWHVYIWSSNIVLFGGVRGSLRVRWLSNHSLLAHESIHFWYLWSHTLVASAWIKWFSRKLSFSTTCHSQKKVHRCFVSASGGLLVIPVTISQAL